MSIPYCPEQAPMGARSSSVKIWGWAVYTEKVLEWFNYPHARAHSGCKVSNHGTEWAYIVGSSVIRWGQPDSGESCIMLQSGPIHSLLVAKFSQHSVIAYSMQISCCRERTLRMRPWMGVWTFDAWRCGVQSAPKQSQLCELSGPTFGFTIHENLARWAVTRRTLKNCKTVKIGVWALAWVLGACSGQYGILIASH